LTRYLPVCLQVILAKSSLFQPSQTGHYVDDTFILFWQSDRPTAGNSPLKLELAGGNRLIRRQNSFKAESIIFGWAVGGATHLCFYSLIKAVGGATHLCFYSLIKAVSVSTHSLRLSLLHVCVLLLLKKSGTTHAVILGSGRGSW